MKKALFILALLGASAFGLASAAAKPKNIKAVIKRTSRLPADLWRVAELH
jgi:hypothetical protein